MNTSLRISILTRDYYTCQYCGRRPPEVKLHVDHIRSRYDGGSDHPSNLVAACSDCNLGKSKRSLLITEFQSATIYIPEPDLQAKLQRVQLADDIAFYREYLEPGSIGDLEHLALNNYEVKYWVEEQRLAACMKDDE